nr:MAG TPA: hypothetical protein [Caudoviricetes sp.]
MQEHNREIMVYSCGGRCWSPACIQVPCSSEAFLRASACAFTTTLNHRRNCCYVSQHYSSHLRLTRQQDWTTSLDGYNR